MTLESQTEGPMALLEMIDLRVAYGPEDNRTEVVRGLDLAVEPGEVLGMLGESGAGKSAAALAVARLIDGAVGSVRTASHLFDGLSLKDADERQLNGLRGRRIAYVFQNAAEAMSPDQRIRDQFRECFEIHGLPWSEETVREILTEVGLTDHETVLGKVPRQLSGGQAQRVLLAMAVVLKPDLIIADEPTSAVDASLRGRIVELLAQINRRHGITLLVITHDFDVAKALCHRVVVLYGGLDMESGPVEAVMRQPRHPFTAALIRCAAAIDGAGGALYTLPGTALNPRDFTNACPFTPRCARRQPACEEGIPPKREEDGRMVRCLFPLKETGGEAHG